MSGACTTQLSMYVSNRTSQVLYPLGLSQPTAHDHAQQIRRFLGNTSVRESADSCSPMQDNNITSQQYNNTTQPGRGAFTWVYGRQENSSSSCRMDGSGMGMGHGRGAAVIICFSCIHDIYSGVHGMHYMSLNALQSLHRDWPADHRTYPLLPKTNAEA